MQTFTHVSVLKREVCNYLNLRPSGIFVDGTLGGCGHALSILKSILPDGMLIGIDQDIDAVQNAKAKLVEFESELKNGGISNSPNVNVFNNVNIIYGNYSALPEILDSCGVKGVDGILLDLGLSFHQLMESQRGFSFQKDEALDMRMDIRNPTTAADIINGYSEHALADIFYKYGEERMSKKIARKIVEKRAESPIVSTVELVEIIRKAMPSRLLRTQKIHPATRVFQALRIEVNSELEHLQKFMSKVPDMLNKGGRLCVISFHSLEDRIVKQSIRLSEKGCSCPKEFPECVCGFVPRLKTVVRKPIVPDSQEISQNPLSRSARLRVAEKI